MATDAELEIPPASVCARCGDPVCEGCSDRTHDVTPLLAWEAAGPWVVRLWSTARATAVHPELVFGRLSDGRIGSAFAFALLAECTALASLALVSALALCLVAPGFAWVVLSQLLSDDGLLAAALLTVPSLAFVMVLLHAAWGLSLELGALIAAGQWRPGRGLRFACYSCGWDLLTSPAGIVLGALSGGAARAWRECVRAAKVPRQAMDAYLEHSRQLSQEGSRRARRCVFVIMGVPMLLGVFGVAWLTAEALWRLM